LAQGFEPLEHEARPDWGRALLAAFALVILAAFQPAHGECLSPSMPAGATATTVYRCPEPDPSAAKQPALGTTEKTTEVERGSADVPWFEPPPGGNKVDAAKMPPAKIEPPSMPDKKIETVRAPAAIEPPSVPDKKMETVKPPEKIEAAKAPEPEEITKIEKKAPAKKKVAGKKRVKKIKVARSKTKKVKAATRPAKVKTPAKVTAAEETPKIESKPPDEKTIVWTKKDMTLGSRVKNWLGF
jgi:hypothetical protein